MTTGSMTLQGGVLSISVTLGDVGSHHRVTFWSVGLHAVSVVLALTFSTHWLIFATVSGPGTRWSPGSGSLLPPTIYAPTVTRGPVTLQRCILPFIVTLRHVDSDDRVTFRTSGLHTVSMVLTVGFKTVRSIWLAAVSWL